MSSYPPPGPSGPPETPGPPGVPKRRPTARRELDRHATDRSVGGSTYSSRLLARVLDDLIRVPGTHFRFGLDPLLGLLPGLGDAAGSAIASIILIDAVRNRVPYRVLVRMGLNLFIDGLLGLLPFVGDVADAAHRANSRNLRLMERTLDRGDQVDVGHRSYMFGAVAIVVVTLLVVVGLAALGIWALLRVIGLV